MQKLRPFALQMLCSAPTGWIDFSGKYGKVLVEPKLDGIMVAIMPFADRANKVAGKAGRQVVTKTCTRSGKAVVNEYTRRWLDLLPVGLHGELTAVDATALSNEAAFSQTMSQLTRQQGEPTAQFLVFNYFGDGSPEYLAKPYSQRMKDAEEAIVTDEFSGQLWSQGRVRIVPMRVVADLEAAQAIMAEHVELGYEGSVVTYEKALYFTGRCNKSNPYALRFKAFEDAEYEILEVIEEVFHDVPSNRELRPELIGRGKGFASSFLCKPAHGFTEAFRSPLSVPDDIAREYWANRDSMVGQLAKVRWLSIGCVNRPRLPVCVGLRSAFDIKESQSD